ncbi:MAG TPA: YHS domain-containing protein [Rhodocyclaceae bacterium]|nr:MAG: YHS domain-containing protein [Rhodocyclales bacterium CG_4_10_14_3_um_filter_68_10]HCX32545.1 YHS domain-containing protein [Rhodocyclaceae bacterium]
MKVTDPVCGMEIDSDAAGAIEEHEGRRYHFCSAQCGETFKADPAKYAAAGAQAGAEKSGCCHHGERSAHQGHGRHGGHGCRH